MAELAREEMEALQQQIEEQVGQLINLAWAAWLLPLCGSCSGSGAAAAA